MLAALGPLLIALPALTKGGGGFLKMLKSLRALGVAGILGKIGAAAALLLFPFRRLLGPLGRLLTALGLGAGLKGVIGHWLIPFLGRLAPLFLGLLGPWGLLAGAIIAAGVLIWQNWDWIKEKASWLWERIRETWDWIRDKTGLTWQDVASIMLTILGPIGMVIGGRHCSYGNTGAPSPNARKWLGGEIKQAWNLIVGRTKKLARQHARRIR